jgi:hypothetical protein
LLFLFYTAILVFIGFLDTRLGFRQEEMRNNAMHNPVIVEIVDSVREIKKEITKDKSSA